MKRIFSAVLMLIMVFTSVSVVTIAADDGIFYSNYIGDSVSFGNGMFRFVNRSIAPITSDNYKQLETIGPDGSKAAAFRVLTNRESDYNTLISVADSGSYIHKAGHTYFRSAMMRLNPEYTDDDKEAGYTIWSTSTTSAQPGFVAKADTAEQFNTAKRDWDTLSDKVQIKGYNNLGTNPTSPSYTLTTEWSRVTEAEYRDSTAEDIDFARWGWVVWRSSSNWTNANAWTGNYQIEIDDYVVLEVPNNDLTAKAFPMVTGVSVPDAIEIKAGTQLDASVGDVYDINPLITPSVTYQWQKSSDDEEWTDISGAISDSYTLTTEDADLSNGYSFRLKVTAISEVTSGEKIEKTAYSNVISTSDRPNVKSVSIAGASYVGEKLIANVDIARKHLAKSVYYQWQISDDNSTFADITGQTASDITITEDMKGKFVRVDVVVETDKYGKDDSVYSDSIKIFDETSIIEYYVDGNATEPGDGSESLPFNTIEVARDEVRGLRNLGITNDIVVYLRGGEYFRDKTFELTSVDKNITFCAYPGERVVFTGGKKVDKADIGKVTDSAVLDRLVEKSAKDYLYYADLSDYIDEIPEKAEHEFSKNKEDYTPVANQVYTVVNGASLVSARWPNTIKEELQITKATGGKQAPQTVTYEDASNRALKWSSKGLETVMVTGHYTEAYSAGFFGISDFNPSLKTFTTSSAAVSEFKTDSNAKIYFNDILDEIDMPGESYTDPETKMVYFYGYGDMENPEVYVPVSEIDFITATDVTDVTFKGINFELVRGRIFNYKTANGCVFDNCDMKWFNIMNNLDGNKNVIKNCFMYDAASGGVLVSGGETKTARIVGGENVITNNRMNNLNRIIPSYAAFIRCSETNHPIITNNEIYNSSHMLVTLGGSRDAEVKNNIIHHGVQWTGDMGAIYWNTYAQAFGMEISNNYFYENESDFGDGWAQSVFWDDTAPGPNLHHNIFYKGTRATSEGGNKYALKSFGGNFANVHNNIFVDVPYAIQFQTYYPYEADGTQTGWWLTNYGKASSSYAGGGLATYQWSAFLSTCVGSSQIKEHYKGTQWEPYMNMFSTSFYNENLKNLDKEKDKEALLELARQYAPKQANTFNNNVVVNSLENKGLFPHSDPNGVETNTYNSKNGLLADGTSIFKDYGHDFSLTDAGLAEVRKTIPGFENIDVSEIGVQTFENNGKTETVGGSYPVVSDVTVRFENGYAVPSYIFSDTEAEGKTQIEWYVSKKADGTFTKLRPADPHQVDVSELEGKYIYFDITPYDNTGLNGIEVRSEPVVVREKANAAKSELHGKLAEAEELLETAVVGSEKGQYPQNAYNRFVQAISDAKTVVENENSLANSVKEATEALDSAITRFKNSVVKADGSSDENEDYTDVPSGSTPSGGGSGSGGGGGGGSSSGGGNKVTYDANKEDNKQEENKSQDTTKPETPEEFVFEDVKGHWAEADIMAMNKAGIVSGVSKTSFEPDREITRAEFATLVAKALNLEDSESEFEDVNASDWFAPFVGAAAKVGIIAGSDGIFRPNDLITRQEMAVIVVKAYEYLEKTAAEAELAFADSEEIADWAKGFVAKAVSAGLMSGMGDNIFAPKTNATRAQAVSVIKRLIG